MFQEFQKIIELIQQLPEADKETAQTAFVTWCVAKVVYFLVAGTVAWLLGRRIIQATFAAWREAKRTASHNP